METDEIEARGWQGSLLRRNLCPSCSLSVWITWLSRRWQGLVSQSSWEFCICLSVVKFWEKDGSDGGHYRQRVDKKVVKRRQGADGSGVCVSVWGGGGGWYWNSHDTSRDITHFVSLYASKKRLPKILYIKNEAVFHQRDIFWTRLQINKNIFIHFKWVLFNYLTVHNLVLILSPPQDLYSNSYWPDRVFKISMSQSELIQA